MIWTVTDFSPGDFAMRRSRQPSHTGLMTAKKLTALLADGYGQGHFHRYKPWLSVTKHDYSPVSNMGHLTAPEVARSHHYRAVAERNTILLAKWLGAIDAREAYPVWPWEHGHPGEGLPNFPHRSINGLMKIAEDAGIDHGRYPGTSLPYVATIDILTTWEMPDRSYKLVALENKPWSIVSEPVLTSRAKERLELTRRYSLAAQIGWCIVHAENFAASLSVNLDHLSPHMSHSQQKDFRSSTTYLRLVEKLCSDAYTRPIAAVVRQVSDRYGQHGNVLWPLVKLAIWSQDVDHDITQPYNTWSPLIRGGREFRAKQRREWLGDMA